MIRVLQIISDTNIGGGGRSLLNYLSCCDRSRFSPSVVLPRGSALTERVRALDVPAEEIDAMADKSLDLRAIPPLTRILRRERPDLVHTHGSLSGRIAARLAGCPVVYTRHCAFPPGKLISSPPGRLANRLLDRLLSDGTIAIGAAAQEILVATGIPAEKIHVMLNGVAPLPRPTEEERRALRASYGFSDGDFVAGILARVEEYKGHGLLLQAVDALAREGRPIKLLVAGSGPFEDELRLRSLSLPEGTVYFAGFVTDVEKAFGAMDVQVNASYVSEASPLSLLEGMSMGLPAVVSDCGGNPLHVTDGENGLIFPSGDVPALTACLRRLMDEPDTLERLSQGALRVFQQRFTGEIFARKLEDIYLQTLKGVQHGRK